MNIGLINYEYPTTDPNCGGGGQVTRSLRTGLEDRGHQVRVVTDGAAADDDPAITGPKYVNYHVSFPFRAAEYISDLFDWADVVNGHFSLPSSLTAAPYTDRAPLALSVMGADIHDPTRYEKFRWLIDSVNRWLFRRSAAIIAPSSDMNARLPAPYTDTARVIHYGIDPDRFSSIDRSKTEPRRILTVCRLVDRKNLVAGIDAVELLRARTGTDYHYSIVGRGPERERLESHDSYGSDWLSLPGYVDGLQTHFDCADLFLLPSKHEAFGVVLLEALSAGLPVVVTPGGGQTDILNATRGTARKPPGVIADSTSAVDISHALERAITDYQALERSVSGYVSAHFSRDRMVERYETVYRELLDRHPRAEAAV